MQVVTVNTVAKNFELDEKHFHVNSYASVLSKRQSQGVNNQTAHIVSKNEICNKVTGDSNSCSSPFANFNFRASENATDDNSVMQPRSWLGNTMIIEPPFTEFLNGKTLKCELHHTKSTYESKKLRSKVLS